MPQIPLYNKGLGSTGLTTGGSLGPRASAGAFTGVGQEVAKFGEAAGNIMFEFYDADKKAEAKTAIADAENELAKELDAHIDNDQSTSMEEFDGNYTNFSNKKIKDIAGKYNLRPNEQKALVAKLGDLSAGAQLNGRSRTYDRRDRIRGISVSDTLSRHKSTMASYPAGHALHEKARINAINLIDESQKDGTIKYSNIRSKNQLDLEVENETIINTTNGANSFADLSKADTIIDESTLSSTVKNKRKKELQIKRKELMNDFNENYQNTMDLSEATFEEYQTINEKLRKNEDINMTLESGKTVSFKTSDIPQPLSSTLQKFNSVRSKEVEDDLFSGITSEVSEAAENISMSEALNKAKLIVSKTKDKQKAEEAIIGSAQYLYYRSKTLLETYKEDSSQVNSDKIRQLGETARQLLQTKYSGRPSIEMGGGTNGKTAISILSGIIDVENDLIKEENVAEFINNGVTKLKHGNYSEIKSNYTATQEEAVVNRAMVGKNQADRLLILQQNNVAYENYKNDLTEGATNILGDQVNIPKLKDQIELFRQMKAMGPGVLQNHLNKEEIAIYNSVLAVEQTGRSIEESINRVNASRSSGIDINAKYKVIENEVKNISSESTSMFGTKPKNLSAIQQKVQNLSKVYIGLGTDPKTAVKLAGQDILNSHINHKGVLIPRSVNMNETDIRYYADLIIDDYKLKNPTDEVEVTATPVTGRIDKWAIVRDGAIFPNETYTLDQLKKMKLDKELAAADIKKKETITAQKKTQESLIKSAEDLRKEKIREGTAELFDELTTTNFSKGFVEKTKAAIAEEKRKENIRKENIKTLKETLLGPKLQ